MSTQIRQQITDEIVKALEIPGNLPPWRQPWLSEPNAGTPANVVSRKPYSGVNPLLLTLAARRHGLQSRFWGTFRQWSDLGARVKARPADVPPGKWGTNIVFCRPVAKTQIDKKGDEAEETFFVLKAYTVFNVDQVEGPFDHLRVGTAPLACHDVDGRIERAEEALRATGADIRHGGGRAYYNRNGDFIQLPPRETFITTADYYQTAFHECCHWTEKRLGWDRSKPEHSSYGLGELVAEIGGCFVTADLGIPLTENIDNHAAYLSGWIKAMKGDTRFIFRATAQASKAADYILSFSRAVEPEFDLETLLVG